MSAFNHHNLTLRRADAAEPEKQPLSTAELATMEGAPSSPSSTMTDQNPHQNPAQSPTSSPRTSRKRMNEELYQPVQATKPSLVTDSEDMVKRLLTAPAQSELQKAATQPVLPNIPEKSGPQTKTTESVLQKKDTESAFEKNGFSALRQDQPLTSTIPAGPSLKPDDTGVSAGSAVEDRSSFQTDIKAYKEQLDKEFEDYKKELEQQDGNTELADLDWDELEARYKQEMDPKIAETEDIMAECAELFQHYMTFMQEGSKREAERSLTRLRTRMAKVHDSEEELVDKKEHRDKVIEAFNNAMALLGDI